MTVVLQRAFAIVGGLLLAWIIVIVSAEVIRTLFGPAFEGVDWPAWFPTTPIILATLVLWFLIARVIWRLPLRRGKAKP